jgi:DNA-binding NarL/FixJ family response regulator
MSDPLELGEPLRIIIADDHALVRGGLSLLVRMLHAETVIQECNDFEKVTRALEGPEPIDLLLIDLLMPGMQSVESIQSICRKRPDLPVIVVSVKEEMQLIRQALRAGASGYIPKSSTPDVTLNAIRLVLSGGIYIPPDALELRNFAADDGTAGGRPKPAPEESAVNGSPLTARQADVLELIAEGKSNQEVGAELGLTAGTVKMHLSRIYKVLNAKSRTDALAKYNRLRSAARRPANEKGS